MLLRFSVSVGLKPNLQASFKSDNKTYGKFGNNTIKINKAIADKLPVFSMTVFHEYWHSIQYLLEKEILNYYFFTDGLKPILRFSCERVHIVLKKVFVGWVKCNETQR